MITKPKLEQRLEQHYVAIHTQVPIPFGALLPPLMDEVHNWMADKHLATAGAPFIRYFTTDMANKPISRWVFRLRLPQQAITVSPLASSHRAAMPYSFIQVLMKGMASSRRMLR